MRWIGLLRGRRAGTMLMPEVIQQIAPQIKRLSMMIISTLINLINVTVLRVQVRLPPSVVSAKTVPISTCK
jgi:hypothetical protein